MPLLAFVLAADVAHAAVAVISRSGWKLADTDSQETSNVLTEGRKGLATYAFDGNTRTMWHTDVNESTPPPPHRLNIDLGAVRTITGFRYLPRQDGNQKGRIAEFEFYVSMDGVWGAPAAVGRFPNTEGEKQVLFTPRQGRLVKLRALNDANGTLFAAVAELNVLAPDPTANTAPNGSIASPGGNATIPTGGSIEFRGSGSDPNGDTPLTYRWTFGPGSGVPDSTQQNPGFVRFERAGTYTVSLIVADAHGLVDPTPATRTVTVKGGQPLASTAWTVRYVDSQETTAANRRATNAFDRTATTYWETAYSAQQPAPPHELQINLGGSYQINGFTYLPPQDGGSDGRIGRYEFYVSNDGTNWGSPVTDGVFPNTPAQKQVFFVTRSARYVRLRALTEVNGKPYTSVAELQVLGAAPVIPSVVLLTPRTFDYQTGADLYALADANLASGQGVRFTLDPGNTTGSRTVDVRTAPFETMFTGVSRGDHTVSTQVIDSGGRVVTGNTTRDYAAALGIGDYYVAAGDSITYGIGDDIAGDNVSRDGRNATQGFTPILQDLLTKAAGHPVAVFNEGLAGELTSAGVVRMRALIQKHPEARRFLLLYGTNDAGSGRASGLGLSRGATGYAGSYKDYLQQLLTVINSAGRQAIVARLPTIGAVNSTTDLRVQEYNRVIGELSAVAANRLTIAGPDLHTYFASRISTQMIGDAVHPNGVGYQGIANLWAAALNGK